MRTLVKKHHKTPAAAKRSGKRCFAVKLSKGAKVKKIKPLTGDWLHLTKADADVLVHLVNTPSRPNPAMKEVEELYSSIPQLD